MAMMSNKGGKKCPLCAEKMDWTDQQLKPCKCGYEVCVWCWHHLVDMAEKNETEGRCPACRTPYDKEKVVGMEAKCDWLIARKKGEIKPQKPKPRKHEEKKDLSKVRVIQRKVAYVIGLPLSLANEDLLQQKDYFGQYGKVFKISLSRTVGGAIQHFINDSCSVYVSYSKEEEAIRCIQSVHGFVLDGRPLRASFGTAKYCHTWLKNMLCNNPACLYLHAIGADEDSFGRDEEAAVHTRNRVYQIVGATHNMQQRSGYMLPPPLDEYFSESSIATEKLISHSTRKELNSNGSLTCSMSSEDQDVRIKASNMSFVDVVARPSSGSDIRNVNEDWKLSRVSSDFSSIAIDEDNYETQHSHGMPLKVSSIDQLPKAVLDEDSPHHTANSCREPECYHLLLPAKDTQHYAAKSFRDPLKYSLSEADYVKEVSCLMSNSSHSSLEEDLRHFDGQVSVHASIDPIIYSDSSNGYAQHFKEISGARDFNADCSNVNKYANEVSVPFRVANSSSYGFTEHTIHSHSGSARKIRSFNSLSNEEIVGQLRRIDGHNRTTNSESSALDAVESNIVSSILSLDFDSCNELYGGSDGRHASLWNFNKNDGSKFSFTEDDIYAKKASDPGSKKYSLFSDYVGKDPVQKENLHSSMPQNNGLRTQTTAPPGFSVAPSCERINRLQPASFGSYSVNTMPCPNSALLNGHTRSASDFDFNDPAPLVRGDNNLDLRTWQTSIAPQLPTYDDEAKLSFLMQQARATQQGTKLAPTFVQDQPSLYQKLKIPASNGKRFSCLGNSYGVNSRLTTDQNQMYKLSSYSQFSQQQYGIGHVSNGCWSSWDETRAKGELGMPEVQWNDILGVDKFFSGHRDLTYQMPSTGDVHRRVYGL